MTNNDIKYLGRFPSDENDPSIKKSLQYGLAWARAIWNSAQDSSFSYSFSNDYDKIIRNRKFARGEHSVEEYKPRAIYSQREFVSLDYSINTPLPKMIRITKDNIFNHGYKARVRPYDSHVHTKYEEAKNKLFSDMLLAKEINAMVNNGMMPPQMAMNPRVASAPKDLAEAEAYLATTFQVLESVAIEKIIRHGFITNNMKRIERKIVTDLVENRHAAMYCSVDENYETKMEYVDILNMVTSYCENDDFSDMTHCGHRKYITVGELRYRLKDVSDQEIFEIAKQNIGKRVNDGADQRFGHKSYFNNLSTQEARALESVMIEIFDFEVIQSDKVAYKEKELSTGGFAFSKKSSGYKPASPRSKAIYGTINKLYRGVWVVDTDYMLSWGLKPNVVRKIRNGKYESKPEFGYIIRKPEMLDMKNVSLCEEAIPHIEQILILEIKKQHFIALSKPAGNSYDIATIIPALAGMGIDGMKPSDGADQSRQTGDVYYSSIGEDGQSMVMNHKPIEFNPSTLDNAILLIEQLIQSELEKVKEIIGSNDAVDGTQPDKRTAVGVQNIALAAHKSSIRALQDTYLDMVKSAADIVAYGQQMAINAGKETESIKELLSDPELKAIKLKEVGEMMFNTHIVMEPDQNEKQAIKMKVDFAIQQGTLGLEDGLLVDRLINESVEKAEIILRQKIEEKARKDAEMEKMRSEMAQQEAKAKAMAEMEKEAMVSQEKLKYLQAEMELKLKNFIEEEVQKRTTMVMEYDEKAKLVTLQATLEPKAAEAGDSPMRTAPPEPKTDVKI